MPTVQPLIIRVRQYQQRQTLPVRNRLGLKPDLQLVVFHPSSKVL